MPPEAGEQVRARADREEQRKPRHTPAGALCLVPIARNHHAGLAEPLRHARGHNADHTGVPALARRDEDAVVQQRRVFIELLHHLCEDVGLDAAALAVVAADFGRKPAGFFGRLGRQQAHGAVRRADAAGRVDARHHGEGDFLRRDGAALQPGLLKKGAQADAVAARNLPDAGADQRAVLARERDRIPDGPDRREVGVIFEQSAGAVGAFQCGEQLERDARAGKIAVRAAAVGAPGVHDRTGRGQLLPRAVVVRHHGVHPEGGRERDFRRGGDAVVHGHNQPHALGVQRPDRLFVQAVALALPLRNIIDDVSAAGFEVRVQHGRGRHAVRIIVAVNRDFFKAVQRAQDAPHGLFHIGQKKRVRKSGFPRKEPLRLPLVRDAPRLQQNRQQLRNARPGGKLLRGRAVVR